MDTDNQNENTSKPWLWQKGQSGNLAGRPKGKTLKEYAKEYLSKLNDEERDIWLDGIEKKEVWKMAEGNPQTTVDGTFDIKVEKLENIQKGIKEVLNATDKTISSETV